MIDSIKNWFEALSKREKIIVISGVALTIIIVFYSMIWSPLCEKVATLQQNSQENQNVVAWIDHAKERLIALRGQAVAKPITNVMVTAEHDLAEAGLAKYLQQVQQPQVNQITVSLHAVPFDQLIDWLQQFVRHYQVEIIQFQATQGTVFGTVEAQVTLK